LAGGVDQQNADVERNLLIEAAFRCVEERPIRAVPLGSTSHLRYSGSSSGGLTTIDDGSTEHFYPGRIPFLGTRSNST
jgi:hypothetical protein